MSETDDPKVPQPSDNDELSALVNEILAERSEDTEVLPAVEQAPPVDSVVEPQDESEVEVSSAAVVAESVSGRASWSRSKKILVGAVGGVIVYAGLVLAVGDEIPSGTRVAGINIGRMSVEDARVALEKADAEFEAKNLTFVVAGTKSKDLISRYGVYLDIDATLEKIPTGSLNPFDLLSAVFSGRDFQPVLASDESLVAGLSELADTVDRPAVEPTVKLDGVDPRVVAGKTGKILDVAAARTQTLSTLTKDFSSKSWSISLKMTPDDPDVSIPTVKKLIKTVIKPALSADVTVTTDTPDVTTQVVSTAIYTPSKIARAMRFTVENDELKVHLDPRTVRRMTEEGFSGVETPVQNATWDVSSGTPVVVPGKPGFGVTDRALAAAIESVFTLPEGQRSATVEFGVIKPSFSTKAAEKAGVKELLATYTQRFPYAPYRSINIGQAAKYIDGTYLAPGAEYSMNGTIRERTYENGYTDGWIIGGGGVFKMEPGGGVSTATTAMFNGAFFSGMEFLEWRAHSIWIPDRYIPGREATVFWGALDMRFKNPHPTGVFITTYMTKTSITVKFWGTKQWDKIDSVLGEKRNISQARTIQNDQADCHEQNGVIGFQITVDRVFYTGDVEAKREPFNTTYRAAPEVVCTYKAKPTKKPTPKPTPKPTKTTKTPTATPTTTPAN